MDLKEIVNRPDDSPITQEEACFVIAEYVKERKGANIKPSIDTRMGSVWADRETQLMYRMLEYAVTWYRRNPQKT